MQGIRVYDSTGNLLVDTSTYILKSYISIPVTSNGAVTVLPPANTTVVATIAPSAGGFTPPDTVEVTGGTTVTWTLRSGSNQVNVMLV